ncbi:serine/threonine protein kinase [Kitasatospora aureofaciens]|uniref:serine/threonine protein kinase n=1 Tax=Kitasatospora aureofaciens TaxID=1894 RepID=UPI0033B02BE4
MSSAGTVLGGRYTLVEKIGGGGMGAVWRADDEVLARPVAVKILRADLFEDDTAVQRFRREAQLVAAIDHPGIVDVHDYGESGGGSGGGGSGSSGHGDGGEDGDERCAYIVMDLIEGRPLDRVLKDDGPMSAERALGLLADALDALHAAHRRGIVHRDLKPSNLMVREDGGVVITDFGIARAVASTKLTAPYAIIGTAAYMSPEQASGEATGPASDLYSIGVVCYELLVGRVPYLGEGPLQVALKHVNQPVPELPETFPAAVRALVATALAKRPEDRFESAAGMAAAARVAIGLPGAPRRAVDSGTIDLRPGAGAVPAGAGTPGAPDQVVKADPRADTEPGGRRSRRALLLPIVVPVVISMGTATALLIDRSPGNSTAAVPPAAQPTVVVTVPAAPSTTTPAATTPASASAQPTDTPSGSPAADQPSGGQLPAPVPAQGGNGGNGAAQGHGGVASNGGSSGGSSGGSNGGSSGGQGNQPAGGGGAANQPPGHPGNSTSQGGTSSGSPSGGNPPAPQSPARPASCGGDSWTRIVSVQYGLPIGMASDSLAASTPIVLGGASQYGWVVTPGNWYQYNACNANGPQLVQVFQSDAVTLSPGMTFLNNWTVQKTVSGAYTLAAGQSCMTANGEGRNITMQTCTPGLKAQEWRFQQ